MQDKEEFPRDRESGKGIQQWAVFSELEEGMYVRVKNMVAWGF